MVIRTITAQAPIRVCDVGGWTDTWFAKQGCVCSIAVNRYVHVTIEIQQATHTSYLFHVRNYNLIGTLTEIQQSHPLLAVALTEIPLAEGFAYTITINADMPPGSSTGTSASVSVALLAALAACNNQTLTAAELARRAHLLETLHLGQQSGVQDQCGAAFGGANVITITEYPHTTVTPIPVNQAFITAFNQQHILYYYGKPHRSSDIHQQVIERITRDQASIHALTPLRSAANAAANALHHNDLREFARTTMLNTEAQSQLHPELVNTTAHQIIAIAQQHAAWGWKVNGAGGDGGSISVIASNDAQQRQQMIDQIEHLLPFVRRIPCEYSETGVEVRTSES